MRIKNALTMFAWLVRTKAMKPMVLYCVPQGVPKNIAQTKHMQNRGSAGHEKILLLLIKCSYKN